MLKSRILHPSIQFLNLQLHLQSQLQLQLQLHLQSCILIIVRTNHSSRGIYCNWGENVIKKKFEL